MQTTLKQGPCLQVLEDNAVIQEIAFDRYNEGQEISFGRDPAATIPLNSASLSRIQLKLTRQEKYFYLIYHSPKIETSLNGELLDGPVRKLLGHNSLISFENSNIALRFIDHEDTIINQKPVRASKSSDQTVPKIRFELVADQN